LRTKIELGELRINPPHQAINGLNVRDLGESESAAFFREQRENPEADKDCAPREKDLKGRRG